MYESINTKEIGRALSRYVITYYMSQNVLFDI